MGDFHFREEVALMNTYEEFMVIINIVIMIIAILKYSKDDKGKKK